MPLDAQGAPTGPPKRLTPAAGHVLVYDVREGDAGAAVVVYSDGDAPSGGAASALRRIVLREGGATDPQPLGQVSGEFSNVSALPGWAAVVDLASETRLAPAGPLGELLAPLEREPTIGPGEPVAASGDRVLVARPGGNGVRVFVTTCAR
jgi:hypothetical protein